MRAERNRGAALASTLALACSVVGAAAASMPDGRYRAMVDRPLFAPSRRPPPPPPPPLPAPAPLAVTALPEPMAARPDVSLSGVIAGGGRGGIALVRRPQDGAPTRLALGGQIDGWTLAAIRPRAIVLRRDGRDVTVELPSP